LAQTFLSNIAQSRDDGSDADGALNEPHLTLRLDKLIHYDPVRARITHFTH
jgi:hypothetical protein